MLTVLREEELLQKDKEDRGLIKTKIKMCIIMKSNRTNNRWKKDNSKKWKHKLIRMTKKLVIKRRKKVTNKSKMKTNEY